MTPFPQSAAERDGLLAVLREHRSDDSSATERVALAIASACSGDHHLWEDLGLPDRAALSLLIRRHFPTLYYKNTGHLRWKKFLYKQLCDRAEGSLCRAPSCGSCSDYTLCFGEG